MLFSKLESAKIRVHTTKTAPGFHLGIMKKPAHCDFEFPFIDSAS